MASDFFASNVEKVLISEEQLQATVTRLAGEIEQTYQDSGRPLLLIGVLKGSIVFLADLMRALHLPLMIDFVQASSYGAGTVSSGTVHLRLDLKQKDLSEVDVLVVEDILDSGNTLAFLLDYLRSKGANSVRLCVLLNKPARRITEVPIDFEGLKIPDEFVVGYGLDFDERFRNLPFIGVPKREIYENC